MAEFSIDVNQLLFNTFGVAGVLRYPDAGKKEQRQTVIPYSNIPLLDDDVIDGYSIIGTPMFMPYSVLPGSYMKYGNPNPVQVPGYDFPDTTLCVFDRNKNIVKTPVEGEDGTVKELISMGDWQISMTGVLVSPGNSNKYPAEAVQEIVKMFEVPATYKVAGKLFSLLGIHSIAYESIKIPQVEGWKNMQPFQLNGCSDKPFEIKLKNALK